MSSHHYCPRKTGCFFSDEIDSDPPTCVCLIIKKGWLWLGEDGAVGSLGAAGYLRQPRFFWWGKPFVFCVFGRYPGPPSLALHCSTSFSNWFFLFIMYCCKFRNKHLYVYVCFLERPNLHNQVGGTYSYIIFVLCIVKTWTLRRRNCTRKAGSMMSCTLESFELSFKLYLKMRPLLITYTV